MEKLLRDHELIEVIDNLASQGASGRLEIMTGMTKGAVFFDRGEIVDANLGKLSGFQAINAISSIPEAEFNFDPLIAPPAKSSITPSERTLLNDFFGIGKAQRDPHYFEDLGGPADHPPEQVVPLSEVASIDEDEIRADVGEATLVKRKPEPEPAMVYESISRRRFPTALFVGIIAILMAAAAVALLYRSLKQSSPATATVENSPAPATVETPASTAETTPTANSEGAPAVANLNGNWKVVNTVEQTSYQPYKNLQIGFELAINQTGNEFTGKGQKVSENGRSLPGASRTPIVVQGSVDGDKVQATFSEAGAVRKTSGRFVWRIDKASGALTGTFSSTAARASGRSAATKSF